MRIGEQFAPFVTDLNFPLPPIAGHYSGGKLIICGDGSGLWEDLTRFECRRMEGRGSVAKRGWQFMTLNKVIELFPGFVEHAYSNHPEDLLTFYAARRPEYKREFPQFTHMHSCFNGVTWLWPWNGLGTSALAACLTAVCLGYDEIVLAGIPMDNGPHNGEPPWRKCNFEQKDIEKHFRRAIEIFGGKVKSLSGRTADWLGTV